MSNQATLYKWVSHGGQRLRDVGILADGTLRNPHGYPDDVVRKAVLAANQRRHECRSQAAKRGAQTRRSRLDARVYKIAQRIAAGSAPELCQQCLICGRAINDPQSMQRGVGSDCWQLVLAAIARDQAKHNEVSK